MSAVGERDENVARPSYSNHVPHHVPPALSLTPRPLSDVPRRERERERERGRAGERERERESEREREREGWNKRSVCVCEREKCKA